MKKYIFPLIAFLISTYSYNFVQCAHSGTLVSKIDVLLSEAFFIPIERKWFTEFTYDDDVEYSTSLRDMPDLPNWMFCRHPNGSRDAFIYGSAQELGIFHIEVIGLNRNTYNTTQKVIQINIEPHNGIAQSEVEMKFSNLNVEDIFKSGRLDNLLEIFRNKLWKNSELLYVTKVMSYVDTGGRLPLNPNDKEGVIVRIGGSAAFSSDLESLKREVKPLRNRIPCPPKKTSVERLFVEKNFKNDWCNFRLISGKKVESTGSSHEFTYPTFSSVFSASDDFKPQSINLPRRDFLIDFIVSIVIPSTIVGLLSTALTCMMCCNRDGMDNKMEHDSSVRLHQVNSVHCSSNQIENISSEQNNIGYTPASSLPHADTGSPTSALHKSYRLVEQEH